MSKIVAAVRKEVVVVAGVIVGAIDYVLTNGNVLSAIVPLIVSVVTRTQVSPVAKLEELLNLITQMKAKKTK